MQLKCSASQNSTKFNVIRNSKLSISVWTRLSAGVYDF